MGIFPFFSSQPRHRKPGKTGRRRKRPDLHVEALEDRSLPSCASISGFVYQDANNNGLFDQGELPIGNSALQLKNAQNVVIASTTTDANGFYEFTHDGTVSTTPTSLTRSVEFPDAQTNFTVSGLVDQFDPSLGQLQSVEIIHEGAITSTIRVENTSPTSGSSITGTVSGTLNLTGPGGVNLGIGLSENAGTFNASTFDTIIDFGGTSGHSFDPKKAANSKSVTLTGSAMDPFVGGGQATFTERAEATSWANGGGNLVVSLTSTAAAQVTVTYHYLPNNCLRPGDYTIVQVNQPANFLDGQESSGGGVLNHDVDTDFIPVTLGETNLTDNNFGELAPASLSGTVYHDVNNNAAKDGPEAGIAGVLITLTGINDAGPVSQTATTNPAGFYEFKNLRPGTYLVAESQPSNYLDGKDTIGTIPGITGEDVFSDITLAAGDQSTGNNFGELKPASLAGFVYVDANNNGVKENSEQTIANVEITLTGSNDQGSIQLTAFTDSTGAYKFDQLRPGSYALHETQPASHLDGKDTIGSPGGTTTDDTFADINLVSGAQGVNNNFGELVPSGLNGFVYADDDNDGVKDPGEQGIAGVLITLSGADDRTAVNQTSFTDETGFYRFPNLRPGNYTLKETQPPSHLDGKDTIGSPGGATSDDQFSNINLPMGFLGNNNNFGELKPAGLSGFVYIDTNDNGIKDPTEQGIAGVQIALGGNDDRLPINKTTFTTSTGLYTFPNLRPGLYTLTETQPPNFNDGKDTIGTPGGATGNDQFFNILLNVGILGTNNNFGELSPERGDLGIVKTATPPSVLVGGQFTYTLNITNHGDFTARNVVVSDNLPPEVTYLSAFGPGWTITRAGSVLTMTTPFVAVGAAPQIQVTVQAPIIPGTVTNVTTVTSSTPDDNPFNNRSEVTTLVYNQPGEGWPRTLPPLVAMGQARIVSKNMLFSDGGGSYVDRNLLGNMAFVDGLYRSFLGQPADYASQVAYAQQLQSGSLSREQLVAGFWDSQAHRIQQANNFYQTFYHRLPSPLEQQTLINQLRAGVSEIDIAQNFLTSAEYQATHPTAGSLLAGFYADVLGRVPDLSSQLVELQSLATNDRLTIVQNLLTKPEVYQQIVDYSFRGILRRPATSWELQYWTSQLQSRAITPGVLMQKLWSSSEFFGLVLVVANLV